MSRKVGILQIIKKVILGKGKSYEKAFHEALQKAIKPGEIVWDIGANVGIYTTQFSEWVTNTGKVLAFEPHPSTFELLVKNVGSNNNNKNIIFKCLALSDAPGKGVFSTIENTENTTAHLLTETIDTNNYVNVEISTADMVSDNLGLIPNAVKIDVEGFEEDVLIGGEKTFSHPDCKNIFIEMHFTRMDERKLGDSASRIVLLLKKWGFKIKWIDASHIHATRNQ